ncbi:DegQ family serine endoprotease [Candidatus Venteria ishoeyi]|uniref:DegQ family serine endoprotease n=1 Tax=Candidatus Venteria ishoeyi TaxID=1899563 RepID=UPI0025A5A935|nr:DegQ family serine endoprotease [Candidatus Venteria ishoeyi]MDM8544938.1 DegQ family serine endoprotease [Candidatus Venteria ishoeyi]
MLKYHNLKTFYIPWALLCAFLFSSLHTQAAGLPDFTKMVEQYGPAVVNISSSNNHKSKDSKRSREIPNIPEDSPLYDFLRKFLEEEERSGGDEDSLPHRFLRSQGSGFIISPDGYVVTNEHVIHDADDIIVRLTDRRELTAKVIGTDKRSDLALLKIDDNDENKDLPFVKIGSSDKLKVGEWVLAIGSPFGFENTVTAGIVSAKGRSLPEGNSNYIPFIQTDVAINPGNSGGPLFNLNGEVVGINAQIYSKSGGFMGVSFTIPIDIAMSIINQIKDKGSVSRGWLGVLIQDVNSDLAKSFHMDKPKGALVVEIFDGPAKLAGLKVRDVIIAFDGHKITRSSELPPIVGSVPAGATVDALIIRAGKEIPIKVTVGELPAEEDMGRVTGKADAVEKTARLGVAVTDLDEDMRKALKVEKGGVLVKKVKSDAAKEAGVRKGDVILMLGSQEIADVKSFEAIADTLKAGEFVSILINRKGSPTFLAMEVPEK